MEILRLANVLPLSLMRIVPRDIEFKGYTIPNDTLIIPNIDSVLSDLKIWGDPEVFRPERFLDDNGHLTKPEEWISVFVRSPELHGRIARTNGVIPFLVFDVAEV